MLTVLRYSIALVSMVLLLFAQGFSQSNVIQTIASSKNQPSPKKVLPFSLEDVVLNDSWIKDRELLNTGVIYKLDPERLLHNFRLNAGLKSTALPMEGWESPSSGLRGHFLGHYLSACATIIGKYHDTVLQHRINYIIDELFLCQLAMGGKYLSAFPAADLDTLEKKYGGVWAPYYTIHKLMQGLLDVYLYTGNKKAYQALLNLTEYVNIRMSKLTENEIEKILLSAEANPTNEAGGMNEVLHNLYSISKDPRHLSLAKTFDRQWFYKPLSNGVDILSGLHANTHIVLVNGFARRYENTGELDFKRASLNFFNMLNKHHAYVNGSSSGPRPIATTPTSRIAEHWGHADHLSATLTGHIAEACVIHNTQKLTANLFEWTAQPQYAEAYFNCFYNAVIPLQNELDGKTVYHLPLGSPRKKEFLKENDYRCCNGTGIEAFTRLNANIYFHDQSHIWVNLFVPSKVYWKDKGITIEQKTQFPVEPKTSFLIASKRPTSFALEIFMPSWANTQTKIFINGKQLITKIKPNSYIKIDRIWKNGDEVEIDFNYHFEIKNMPDNPNVIAVFYGPILLAFETKKEILLKGNKASILHKLKKSITDFSFTLDNNNTLYTLKPFYKITNQSYGVYATIRNEF